MLGASAGECDGAVGVEVLDVSATSVCKVERVDVEIKLEVSGGGEELAESTSM